MTASEAPLAGVRVDRRVVRLAALFVQADGALDGGWTAAGMSAYTKKLEDALNEILGLPIDKIGDAYIVAGEALAMRHNVELTGGASAPSSDRRERG